MSNETIIPQRKKNRLKDFDYSSCDTYFITICTKDKKNIFGKITVKGIVQKPECELSDYGKIVADAIQNIEKIYNGIEVDNYIIMPDHVHLLFTITTEDKQAKMESVPKIINQFKGYVSKKIGFSVWQKSYHDHIIRNQKDYDASWQYIEDNPGVRCEKENMKF